MRKRANTPFHSGDASHKHRNSLKYPLTIDRPPPPIRIAPATTCFLKANNEKRRMNNMLLTCFLFFVAFVGRLKVTFCLWLLLLVPPISFVFVWSNHLSVYMWDTCVFSSLYIFSPFFTPFVNNYQCKRDQPYWTI